MSQVSSALIHQIFEEQAAKTPNAIAVEHEGQSLKFSELNGRANQLARYLRRLELAPEELVGICLERGVEMLVSILGVWKAGGAYVPIDPSYPAARQSYIVKDARLRVLLTQERSARSVADAPQRIALEQHWVDISRFSDENLEPAGLRNGGDRLAYVIYTSGSTGEPNGVMVEHANVLSHWPVIERLYSDPYYCRRIAVNAPFTFDVSVQQYLMVLSGRTLFLVSESVRRDVLKLLNYLRMNQIEGIDCTPSQLNTWVSAGLLEPNTSGLKTVIVGGEALSPALWKQLLNGSDIDMVFHNVYGPTETTVFCTSADLREFSETPHIGRSTSNAQVYILDSDRRPVPVGADGEIFIVGAGVSRGYLNRRELTEDRFTTISCGGELVRAYKTGDLARWRADGRIEFRGRVDQQVKIHGFRIEPGEIEAHLAKHPEVSEAVVLARQDVIDGTLLVAYLSLKESPGAEASAAPAPEACSSIVERVRAYLASVLPEHMVPGAFVVLEHWPVTAHGKLDRQGLPAPELRTGSSSHYVQPEGEIEEAIAGIWKEVLRVERVGRNDNFLSLGGHSIKAMRVAVRIAREFGVPIALPDIFRLPTVLHLAQFVEGRRVEKKAAS